MENKYIYVVFSSTPYAVGKLIRLFTGEAYNHVSISLDRDLKQMYGFARRYYRLPLYGGFVKECVSRYHIKGNSANVRICALPVTADQFDRLRRELSAMYENRDRYLYNHFSVLSTLVRRPVRLRDAYTCVEFGVEVLRGLGIQLDPERYYSVGDLEKLLRPYCVYTGPIPETDLYDAAFFSPKPLPHPLLTTLSAMLALFERLD